MQNVGGMYYFQRIKERYHYPVQLGLFGKPTEPLQPGFQRLPTLEVHHHVGG